MGIRPAAAVGVLVAAILSAAPAHAEPPGCTTADMTAVMSGVSARQQTEDYLNANPSVRADVEAVRAPSRDFRARCNLPQRALTLADNL